MSNLQFISIPSELGAGTRGSSLGVAAIRVAALNAHSDLFLRFPFEEIPIDNDLFLQEVKTPYAARIKAITDDNKRLRDKMEKTFSKNRFPFVLCGDHSSSIGVIAGIKKAYPTKRLGVIWIDAHADIHSPFTTPSGNLHGMPIAAALAEDNLKKSRNTPDEKTKRYWKAIKGIAGVTPMINYSDLVYISVRDTEEQEESLMINNQVKSIEVEEIRDKGTEQVVKDTFEHLKDCDIIHVSFDVDSLDCDLVSYGTGTPVPNGLTEKEAGSIINLLLLDKKVVSMDVVEVNPCLDNKGNVMAETALRIIETATQIITKR